MANKVESTGWRDAAALEPLLSVSVPTNVPGGSAFGPETEQLAREIDRHVEGERDAIAEYQRLAQSPDALISLVAYLVLEDEERHHELCRRIVNTLTGAVEPGRPSALPVGVLPPAEAVLATRTLRHLAKQEHGGARFLDNASRAHLDGDDKLTAALLKAMAMDSRKHEFLLTFLAEHAARQAR